METQPGCLAWARPASKLRCPEKSLPGKGRSCVFGSCGCCSRLQPTPRGVTTHRLGAQDRAQLWLDGFGDARRRQGQTEARMAAVLDELQLSELVCSVVGLSALGRATILAETGDLTRFASARAVVKHCGLVPREKSSGTYTGRTKLTGQGRPGQRRAAWRAVWGAQKANPVYAAKFTHLTNRCENKLNGGQAHAALSCRVAAPAVRGCVHGPEMGCGDRRRRQM